MVDAQDAQAGIGKGTGRGDIGDQPTSRLQDRSSAGGVISDRAASTS